MFLYGLRPSNNIACEYGACFSFCSISINVVKPNFVSNKPSIVLDQINFLGN